MKKLALVILVGSLMIATNSFANYETKLKLIRQVYEDFSSDSNNNWMNFIGSNALKNSSKQQQLYEDWYHKTGGDELSECGDGTYHIAFPGNGGIERGQDLSINYFPIDNNLIVAKLVMDSYNSDYTAEEYVAYSVIVEQGQYKIDDLSSYFYDEDTATWSMGMSFKEQVAEYCQIGNR